MAEPSFIARFISRLALGCGLALCVLAVGVAIWNRTPGRVVIQADNLNGIVFVQDKFETHSFDIVNRTGKRIWLHNEQGWG